MVGLRHELVEHLETLFPDNSPPNRKELLLDVKGAFPECEDAIRIFNGRKWRDLSLDDLLFKDEILGVMSGKAFAYYLPAFLKLLIEEYFDADVFAEAVIRELTPPISHGEPRASWLSGWFSMLNSEKKQLIRQILEFVRDQYSSLPAETALDAYWGRI